ncbi:MAG TPA: hypothetical protein DEA08_11740 [Planctomycetes bacterium]|nr:hypothetical protein [Planctomycetota bacterium]
MRRLALGRRRRGFGLLDFMVGTMVFAGVITTFASLTRVKMLTLHEADARRAALARAEAEVDALRSGKELPAPKGQADTDGFRLNARTELETPELQAPELLVDSRALRLEGGGETGGLVEVRVRVRWKGAGESNVVRLSTVLPRRTP